MLQLTIKSNSTKKDLRSPINVRKSSIAAGGPTRGNMRVSAEANTMANIQAPVANEGS